MKKLIAMLLALVMVLSLAACGAKTEAPAPTEAPKAEAPAEEAPATEAPAAPAADPVVLRFAASEAETSLYAQALTPALERIMERTEGRVVCETYYSNALGSINDTIE